MRQLGLTLLGQFQVELDGKPVAAFRTLKVKALLVYLAAEPQAAHRREQLMTLMWPGMPEPSARSNLRQILFHLRRVIPDFEQNGAPVPLLIANRQTIQLNPLASVTTDIRQLDSLQSQVQRHDHVTLLNCQTCYEMLAAAVSLYRGDFLADLYLDDSNEFEEWAEVTRQQYRRKVLDALETLTAMATHRAAYAEAQRYAEQQIRIDNLRESAYRQLMEVLALSGRRTAALSLYESYRRLLADELGMAPSSATTELYERIRLGELSFDRPQIPGVRGYELGEEIGAGAFGVVHRAVQAAVGRTVAIKIIRREHANDPAFIRRFEAEAQIIARLEHPHIVPLYDYWREPSGAFLVMRWLRGGNLLSKLEGGAWSLERTRIFLEQIAAALHAAHQQSIIHRDLKPANFLFDDAGNAYLSDFGIAKDLAQEQQLAAAGEIGATFDYVSPEELLGGPVTPQTDIYSLGAVLYEILTGERPFGNRSPGALIQSHLSAPFPLVNESQPDFPTRIDDVLQQATAKQPEERFPTVLALADAFSSAVDGRAAPITAAPPAIADGEIPSPYKGLRAYQEADAGDFYGREALISQLINRLADRRFLAIVGPSGSGKSSVVKAGLIPALRQGALSGSDKWYIAQMVPGAHPLEELELALWPIAVNPPPSLMEPMEKDSRGMLRTIRRILPAEENAQLLLVIDQFEELFTMVDDEARRTHFLESLLVAISAQRSPLRVVVTLRADFYDRPLQHQPLGALFKNNTELVLPLNRDELLSAIQEPARRVGVTFEDGLLAAIMADVAAQPGALPLLQYALTELFASRDKRQMTRQAYAALGGVPGALARRADEIFFALSPAQQTVTRQLFSRLVTPGEALGNTAESPDIRRRARLSEVHQVSGADEGAEGADTLTGVLDRFGEARLLTFDHDPVTREPMVEVAHEALLSRWERLAGWLAESRNDMRWQRQLASAAADWEASGRDDGYLLRGPRLTQFETWWQQSTIALLPQEQAFLDASLSTRAERRAAEAAQLQRQLETARRLAASEKKRAEEQVQAATRLRKRAVGLAGALIFAAVLAVLALLFGQLARQNAAIAERSAADSRSAALASGAQAALADANSDLALALALAANDMSAPPPFAQRTLYEVALSPGTARRIVAGGGWRWSMDVHPNGRLLVSGADDGVVTIWDLTTGEEMVRLEGEHAAPAGAVFTPDGRFVLTGDYDDKLILWDVSTAEVVWRAVNPTGDPNGYSVSPDSTLAAIGTEQGVVTLWDVATGDLVGELAGHDPERQVLPVTFSPDGHLLASGAEDGEAIIWDVANRTLRHRIQVFDDVLFGLAFSPDGQTLAAAGKSNSVWLIDVASGEVGGILPGLPDWAFDLAFSPDGTQLLVGSRDGAVMVWDAVSRKLQKALYGEGGFALNVAFVNQATAVASYNTGNFRVWDLADSRRQQSYSVSQTMSSIAQSADGRLAAVGLHEAIRLLDLHSGETVRELGLEPQVGSGAESGYVTALAFDPSGTQMISGSDDGRLFMWDVASGERLHEFDGHRSFIHQVAFSPDGRHFLSVSDDRQVIMWDAVGGQPRFTYTNPTDAVTAVAFSPDGSLFATGVGTTRYVADFDVNAQRDTRILLWDTATGMERGQLPGHEAPVTAVAFSPDGRLLLSGALDATIRLWELPAGGLVRHFDGHTGGIRRVAFSSDGVHAVSSSQDGVIIVWDAAAGDLLRQIKAHDGVIHHVSFTASGDGVWSAGEDGGIHSWVTALDAVGLQDWIVGHRHVAPLTCLQQVQYGLIDNCPNEQK